MDYLQRAALRRAQDAIATAVAGQLESGRDDELIGDLVHSLVDGAPRPIMSDEKDLRAQGFMPRHWGTVVKIERILPILGRDLTTSVGTGTSKAGYLIGTAVPYLVEELAIAPSVLRAGATVLPGLKDDTRVPLLQTNGTGYWLTNEGDAPSAEEAPTFGNVTLTPKTVSTYLDFSRRLNQQSSVGMANQMRRYLGSAVARAIDQAALVGTGANGQPLGIVGTSGIGSVAIGTNGGALTRAKISELITAITGDNGLKPESRLAFLINSKTAAALYKTETSSGSGRYLYEPTGPSTGILGGFPAFINDHLPSNGTKGSGTNLSTLVFGDWAALLIGHWGAVEFLANPYTAGGSFGMTRLHCYVACDIALPHPEAFAVCSDITTT